MAPFFCIQKRQVVIVANAGELTARIVLGGMDAVERQLRGFSTAMNNASKKATDMGRKMQEAGEGISGMGESLAPISAGFLALGGASIVASNEISDGISAFQTKLGASGKDLEALEGNMNAVAKTGIGSFTEVADSIVAVEQNMQGLSGEELNKITEQSMALAQVMGVDVADVTKSAGLMMKNFGIEGQTAMDLIAKGNQIGLDTGGELLDTLGEYSVQFSDMGFSAEDMFNMLASGMENGAFSLDKLGDGIKEFNLRAGDGSKATGDAFTALGLDATAMGDAFNEGGDASQEAFITTLGELSKIKDATERNNTSVALFGATYEDLQQGLIKASTGGKNAMKGFGGTAEQVAKDNAGFSQQMMGAWNQIQIAIKPVGDVLKESILTVLPYIIAGITTLAGAFTGLSPTIQKIAIAFGALIAFLPALLMGVGTAVSMFGTLATGAGAVMKGFSMISKAGTMLINGFKMVGTAFRVLSALLMANPWMLLIAGIIIVAVLIYKYWDEIVAGVKTALSALGAFFSPFWNGLKEIVASVVTSILAGWASFKTGFMAVLTAVGSFFMSIWNGLKTAFMAVLNFYIAYYTTIFHAFVTVAQTVWNVIKTVFMVALGLIIMLLAPLWNAFATGWNAMVSVAQAVMGKVKSLVSSAISVIVSLWNKLKSGVQKVWNAIYSSVISPAISKIKSIVNTLISKVQSVMSSVKSAFSSAWNAVYSSVISPVISKIKSIVNTLISKVSSVMSKVKSTFSSAWSAISSKVSSVISKIVSIITKIVDKAKTVGSGVKSAIGGAFDSVKGKVSSAISAITGKIGSIWDKAKGVASNIKSAFSNLFGGIKVPSFSMGGWSVKDLPKMPKMSVKWHANGGILDSATMIGAGEAGAEAIVPLSSQRKMKPFAQAVSKFMPNGGGKSGGDTNIHVAQLVVREEADLAKIAQELNRLQARKERAKGGLSFS